MKTFLITGCTRGIGLATAEYLKESGHQVIGIARKQPDTKFPGVLYCADLSNSDETLATLEIIKQNHSVDGIINNIGNVKPMVLESMTVDSFMDVIDLNVRPAIQVTQAFLPHMKNQKWGRIVNIASRAMLGKIARSSYSAAKASLVALTKTWALELAPFNIMVNAVAPGPIQTESFYNNYPKGGHKEKQLLSTIPLNRLGMPDEVAYAIGFFLNERASFITGQTLFVDGGGSIGIVQ